MNTFTRTVLASAAACAAVGIGSAAASTEPPGSPVDEATAGPQLPTAVTACWLSSTTFRAGTDEILTVPSVDGDMTLERRRGFTWRGETTASDPRLTGTEYYSFDTDNYTLADGGQGVEMIAEGVRIENDEGAWQGSALILRVPGDASVYGGDYILVGEGAYAGLTAVLTSDGGGGGCFSNFSGYIIEITPPVPHTGE